MLTYVNVSILGLVTRLDWPGKLEQGTKAVLLAVKKEPVLLRINFRCSMARRVAVLQMNK